MTLPPRTVIRGAACTLAWVMKHGFAGLGLCLALWGHPAAAGAPDQSGQAQGALRLLREGGCGGSAPAAPPLMHDARLDRAAAAWANGHPLRAAAESAGYAIDSLSGVRVSGPPGSLLRTLQRSQCAVVTDRAMRDFGVYGRGPDTWIVLASSYRVPQRAEAPALAARALALVNAARARGARCGERWFPPAPPVRPSSTLDLVALGHADDMARHGYFEHRDLSGKSPADRVRAAGYREMLVGENIAYGVQSADEAVRGWLDSPGHCENIMNPRFAEMGLGFAAGRPPKRGLYWVQLLAVPRA